MSDFFIIVLFFLVFRFFILELGFSTYTKEIPIGKLKRGMVLADVFYEGKARSRRSLIDYFMKSDIDARSEGVTAGDIRKLKDMKVKTVRILETLPFAPFMLFGALLTFIFGNIAIALFR